MRRKSRTKEVRRNSSVDYPLEFNIGQKGRSRERKQCLKTHNPQRVVIPGTRQMWNQREPKE